MDKINRRKNLYLSVVAVGFGALILLAFAEKYMPAGIFRPILYGALALLVVGNILLYVGIRCPKCGSIIGYVIVFSAEKVGQCPRCRVSFDQNMPPQGNKAGSATRWRDYLEYLVSHQSRARLAVMGLFFALLVVKSTGVSLGGDWLTVVSACGSVGIAAFEAVGHAKIFFMSGNKTIQRTMKLNFGGGEPFDLLRLRPSPRQAKLGFEAGNDGVDRIMASDGIDDALRARDWTIRMDPEKPRQVAETIRAHRNHCLSYLTMRFREAGKARAIFRNDRKLCLSDELEGEFVRCHEGGYFDSLCTNEACTAVIASKSDSTWSNGGPLFPMSRGVDGYYLDDLDSSDANNHIGVSCLAITADRYFVVWQQTAKNIQDPGKVVSTGSGSCDFSDLQPSSLKGTIVAAMEREIREESRLRNPAIGNSATAELFDETNVIGFFRWIQRGGKPEFLGVSRLKATLADLSPDGLEACRIGAVSKSGAPVRLQNSFLADSVDRVPQAFAGMRRLFAGTEEVCPLPVSLPLQRILVVLERLHGKDPARLRDMLYGR